MPEIKVHNLVPYPPLQMFEVVADVEAYPQFVPYCSGLRVLAREKKTDSIKIIVARMTVRHKIFEEQYTSRVTLDRGALAIDVTQTEGPFSYLSNTWRFEEAGQGTKIHFYLSYEFRSRLLGVAAGPLFQKLFRNFESAFEQRAAKLIGDKA